MVFFPALAFAQGSAPERIVPMPKEYDNRILIPATGRNKITQDDRRREATIPFVLKIANLGDREIVSMTFVVVLIDGTLKWQSAPVRLTSFANYTVPYRGSLLPLEQSRGNLVTVKVPYEHWRRDIPLRIRMVSSETVAQPDLRKWSRLYTWMAKSKGAGTVALFKKRPELLNVRGPGGLTVAHAAFATSDRDTIRYVLGKTGPPRPTADGSTPLHLAAIGRYKGSLDIALGLGGPLDPKTKNGDTPLIRALKQGNADSAIRLIEKGADLKAETKEKFAAWQYAIFEQGSDALAVMHQRKFPFATIRNREGDGAVHTAVLAPRLLTWILSIGGRVNDRNPKTGVTPLMKAMWIGKDSIVIRLLKAGADPDLKDLKGRTALSRIDHPVDRVAAKEMIAKYRTDR